MRCCLCDIWHRWPVDCDQGQILNNLEKCPKDRVYWGLIEQHQHGNYYDRNIMLNTLCKVEYVVSIFEHSDIIKLWLFCYGINFFEFLDFILKVIILCKYCYMYFLHRHAVQKVQIYYKRQLQGRIGAISIVMLSFSACLVTC